MKKRKARRAAGGAQRRRKLPPPILCAAAAALAALAAAAFLAARLGWGTAPNVAAYKEKLALLEAAALTAQTEALAGRSPAGGQAGHAVFLSLCDTTERASVFCGTGADLRSAWGDADAKATAFLEKGNYDPEWVKADVVCSSDVVTADELARDVLAARHEFYRMGVAFDPGFGTALLEAELNGAKIYDYDNGGIDLGYLDTYLRKAGRAPLGELPEAYVTFRCAGWLCDGEGAVHALSAGGLDYGRRTDAVDADYALGLIMSASAFLEDQVREDGSFVYGIYPRFDNDIDNYNIVRHASTLWSLVCRYRLAPDEALRERIDRAVGFMLDRVVYDQEGRAFLYEEKADEIKLGGCGVAVVALTEYMDAFGGGGHEEVCRALGRGILSMMDRGTGEYYHVLNGDFSRKEALRTVYYDGEATFALCRLYSLTGEAEWLEAAESAVARFIREDYARYKDHWVAYSMNEITRHVTDNGEYYAFALENAQRNLREIRDRDTTYHTYLELLMATFEVYDRMRENGVPAEGFDLPALLDAIRARADRQLDGYFYPEYAMYMKNPRRVLGAFMVRHDGYRVRIDDVQHNIGGYYLYAKNYDKLVAYGLLDGPASEGDAAGGAD